MSLRGGGARALVSVAVPEAVPLHLRGRPLFSAAAAVAAAAEQGRMEPAHGTHTARLLRSGLLGRRRFFYITCAFTSAPSLSLLSISHNVRFKKQIV